MKSKIVIMTLTFTMLMVLLVTVFAQSDVNPLRDNLVGSNPWEGQWLPVYYACAYGQYAPACAALNSKPTVSVVLREADTNPVRQFAPQNQLLPMYYACTYGNYTPACAAINHTATSNFPQDEVRQLVSFFIGQR